MAYQVFVRAKTRDGRWVSVDVADLDERSWRAFLAHKLCEAGLLAGMIVGQAHEPPQLTTPLSKAQVDRDNKEQPT